jgi:hypothetical protein
MNFLRKLFDKRQPAALSSSELPKAAVAPSKPVSSEAEFYQYDMNSVPKTSGLCSDRECPCPETRIPKGSGYLYISQDAVVFMKAKKEGRAGSGFVFGPMPILVCEQGAKLRGIDMKVAADDAKRWWETGRVLLRPTPRAKSR